MGFVEPPFEFFESITEGHGQAMMMKAQCEAMRRNNAAS